MINNLSDKQKYSLTYSDARLNIWEGAVRSGKSFSALLRFIEFALSPIVGDFVIIGKTEDALKRNIITELARLLGTDVRYIAGKRELFIFNRRCYVIGANDERSEGKIRGATFAGALVDEATTIPENFFKMLLSRLSVEGAKLFATTNPDSPFHWLKKEYIDRGAELDLKRFQFVLDDNPSLTDFYKDNLKKEYIGLWHKRFILGQWVLAEGAIYDFFDSDIHCVSQLQQKSDYYIVGVDYGTTNPCAFLMCGCNTYRYPRLIIEKEYNWNSKEELRQKTDSEYCDDLVAFCADYHVRAIVIDPSAASFIAECRKRGIHTLVEANNDVLDGIRFVSQLLSQGTLKIHRSCENLIREIETYVWDDAAALRGIEKPKKVNDHCTDALRYLCMYFFRSGLTPVTAEELNQRYLTAIGARSNIPRLFPNGPY